MLSLNAVYSRRGGGKPNDSRLVLCVSPGDTANASHDSKLLHVEHHPLIDREMMSQEQYPRRLIFTSKPLFTAFNVPPQVAPSKLRCPTYFSYLGRTTIGNPVILLDVDDRVIHTEMKRLSTPQSDSLSGTTGTSLEVGRGWR